VSAQAATPSTSGSDTLGSHHTYVNFGAGHMIRAVVHQESLETEDPPPCSPVRVVSHPREGEEGGVSGEESPPLDCNRSLSCEPRHTM